MGLETRLEFGRRTFDDMANKFTQHSRQKAADGGKAGREVQSQRAWWQAVQVRDKRADGSFVYAVRSTGIYCKPSCPSRRPRRAQVEFFILPAAAEQNGFRACKRCKPRLSRVQDPRTEAVARVCREIDKQVQSGDGLTNGAERSDFRLTLSVLSAIAGMGPHQLERAFRSVMGISPRQYADARRMQWLKSKLKKGDDVTTALYEAGFGSSSRLYERAPGHLGMTPATYRRGGAGMEIHFTIANSPLGRLLVGATERGISALYLGTADSRLEAALRKEYPRAEIRRDRNGMQDWLGKIIEHLRGHEPNLDLPTDVQATAFQRRVWEELRRIPYGSTRTYSQVARAIGRPTAIRAVARACATNPVSVVVPCHRVVREDGNLAGYRWGLERKRELLEHEAGQTSLLKSRSKTA
jgi:AraC family transcriptional regulator, regulatory protein of adaptative response / methylated-DNA-[protein]-cysteine methyltransferase